MNVGVETPRPNCLTTETLESLCNFGAFVLFCEWKTTTLINGSIMTAIHLATAAVQVEIICVVHRKKITKMKKHFWKEKVEIFSEKFKISARKLKV